MAFYIGIDGGGSKTSCIVGDDSSVLGTGEAGPSNVVRVGEAAAQEALHGAILQACNAAQVSPKEVVRVCVGAAGAARPEIRSVVHRLVSELVLGEVEVAGDTVIALQAAFHGKPGVVVIAGTGSVAYGRNASGETARAGGWGFAISDEGSGHWIGRAAVAACMRVDDEGKSTTLMDHILETWGLAGKDELVLAANRTPHPDFAELVPAVLAASDAGDPLATKVLKQAGAELAELAKIVLARLFPGETIVDVATYGGVFANCAQVCGVFYNNVCAAYPRANVGAERDRPVLGALELARRPRH